MLARDALGLPEGGTNSGKSLDSIVCTKQKRRQMEKLILMREVIIMRYIKVEYTRV